MVAASSVAASKVASAGELSFEAEEAEEAEETKRGAVLQSEEASSSAEEEVVEAAKEKALASAEEAAEACFFFRKKEKSSFGEFFPFKIKYSPPFFSQTQFKTQRRRRVGAVFGVVGADVALPPRPLRLLSLLLLLLLLGRDGDRGVDAGNRGVFRRRVSCRRLER